MPRRPEPSALRAARVAQVQERSTQLKAGLDALADKYGIVAEVRGWGLLLGIELKPESNIKAAQLCAAAMRENLLTVPAGERVLRLVPPLVVSAAECDEALAKLGRAVEACMKEAA